MPPAELQFASQPVVGPPTWLVAGQSRPPTAHVNASMNTSRITQWS